MCNTLHQQVEMGTNIWGKNSFPRMFPVGISEMIQRSAYQTHGMVEPK